MNYLVFALGFTTGIITLHIAQALLMYRLRAKHEEQRSKEIDGINEFLKGFGKVREERETEELKEKGVH